MFISMKILKVKSRTYNGKDYYKYRINIPEKMIKESNLTEQDELEIKAKDKKLEIKKKA